MLLEWREERYWQEYTADHLWLIGGALCALSGRDYDMPNYSTVIHPEENKQQTAEEIKQQLLAELRA